MRKVTFSSLGEGVRVVRSDLGGFVPASLVVLIIMLILFAAQVLIVSWITTGEIWGEAPMTYPEIAREAMVALPFEIALSTVVLVFDVGLMGMALDKLNGQFPVLNPPFARIGQFLAFQAMVSIMWSAIDLLLTWAVPLAWAPWSLGLSLPLGLLLYAPLWFAPLLIARGGYGWVEASVMSIRILWRQTPMVYLVMVLGMLLSTLGLLALLVGLIFTFAIYPAVIAVNYRRIIEGIDETGRAHCTPDPLTPQHPT